MPSGSKVALRGHPLPNWVAECRIRDVVRRAAERHVRPEEQVL
jgi:hypothetical protein